MDVKDIKQEIERQINIINYLEQHPEAAQHAIKQESSEFSRGSLSTLNYLKKFINHME